MQVFDWAYASDDTSLAALYTKSKVDQWDAERDVDWNLNFDDWRSGLLGPEEALGDAGQSEVARWALSQILHGEQGALLAAAAIVERAPSLNLKAAASVQVADEMRHIEVFERYLATRYDGHFPPEPALEALLRNIAAFSDWDLIGLGTHILIEGLALASFGLLKRSARDPLLRQILRLVMRDEARHVSIGLSTLGPVFMGMSSRELRERQEFVIEALVMLYERDRGEQLVRHAEGRVPPHIITHLSAEQTARLRHDLSDRIVPYCRRLGLLTANNSHLEHEIARLDLADI